jgi:tetratricopeptide (TPR) repeat protein
MGGRVASPTFVGRAEELALLEAARGRVADGEPAVVLVGGEAGVGKTRLIAELMGRCATDGTRVLSGGCMPVGDGDLPYAPIVEILRSLVREVGPGAVREFIGPSWPELARVVPALGESDHAGQTEQAAQARLFELLLGLLGRLSEQTQLVLVVEDLHWADRSTRDLLVFLVRNLRQERLPLVISYRNDEPGQQQLGPYLAELDRVGRVERIELSRLDQVQTGAQLAGILEAAPTADLLEAVFARSEGNPYFTEELLAVVRAGSGELPATLRDLLRGRAQRLPDHARQVLTVVAVAGRRVPHRLLVAVAGLDDQQLVEALRAAVANQLLVTESGEDGYRFRHALLREVIEADLLPGERARLHAGLARALTEQPELAGDSQAVAAAELAAHWDAAGDPTQALPAKVGAGLAADRARAFPEAQRHYERALQLWEQVSDPGRAAGLDQIELLTRAADAAGASGRTQRALVLLTTALDQLDPTDDPVRAALLHMRLGGQRWGAGDEPACLAALEKAARILPPEPSPERARVLAYHAKYLMLADRWRAAARRAEEALAVARTVGARAEEGHALDILGVCTRDIERLVEARRIAEELGNAEGIARAYLNLGSTLSRGGRQREALDVFRRGLTAARELGLERAMGSVLAVALAQTLFELGDWKESGRVVAEDLERGGIVPFRLHAVKRMLDLGRGDFPAAREQLELAVGLSPSPIEASWPLTSLAELAIWEGRYDDARAAVDQAVNVLQPLDPEEELPPTETAELPALGLRVEADCGELARAAHSAAGVQEARRRAEPLVAHAPSHDRTDWRSLGRLGALLCGARRGRVVPARGPAGPAAVARGRRDLGAAGGSVSGGVRPLPAGRSVACDPGASSPGPTRTPGRASDGGQAGGGAAAAGDRAARPTRPSPPRGAPGRRSGTRAAGLPGRVAWPYPPGNRGADAGGRRADQPADRPGAVHHPQDRQRPRLEDPRQAGGGRAWGGGRDRPPARPRQALILGLGLLSSPSPGSVTSRWQHRPRHPEALATPCSTGPRRRQHAKSCALRPLCDRAPASGTAPSNQRTCWSGERRGLI